MKPKTVPLWARNNTSVRIQARKPDQKPLWMHAMNHAMTEQGPLDIVGKTLAAYRKPRGKKPSWEY